MTTSLDSLQLYTKVLTGMVLLLNIGLLVAIRMALNYARLTVATDGGEDGVKRWAAAKRHIVILILTVIGMNAGAVFANQRVVNATRTIAAEMPQDDDTELVLSTAKQPQ